MSVVAVKINNNHIVMAGDSQSSFGRNKFSMDKGSDAQLKTAGKIFQTNGLTIGCAGSVSHIGLLRIFSKTHKPKSMTKDDVLDWFIDFKDWAVSKTKIKYDELSIHGLIVSQGLAFVFYDFLDVQPVTKFWAVGSGMFLAIGAMDNGANAEKAIEIAKKYDLYCGGETTKVKIENE